MTEGRRRFSPANTCSSCRWRKSSRTRNRASSRLARAPETFGRVSRSRNVARNAWVVAGTRIPVAAIKRLGEDGYGVDAIIAEYPQLTPADVRAALSYEADAAA